MIEFIDQHFGLLLLFYVVAVFLSLTNEPTKPPDLSCWDEHDDLK
jgi:hypothetical protein